MAWPPASKDEERHETSRQGQRPIASTLEPWTTVIVYVAGDMAYRELVTFWDTASGPRHGWNIRYVLSSPTPSSKRLIMRYETPTTVNAAVKLLAGQVGLARVLARGTVGTSAMFSHRPHQARKG